MELRPWLAWLLNYVYITWSAIQKDRVVNINVIRQLVIPGTSLANTQYLKKRKNGNFVSIGTGLSATALWQYRTNLPILEPLRWQTTGEEYAYRLWYVNFDILNKQLPFSSRRIENKRHAYLTLSFLFFRNVPWQGAPTGEILGCNSIVYHFLAIILPSNHDNY